MQRLYLDDDLVKAMDATSLVLRGKGTALPIDSCFEMWFHFLIGARRTRLWDEEGLFC
jgi:hypothetical protein